MTEYLKQDKTGRVYVKTETFAQRKDMKPYEWPGRDDSQKKEKELPPSPPAHDQGQPLTDDLDTMTSKQLVDYAMEKYGVEFSARKRPSTLIKDIRILEVNESLEGI